MLSDSFNVFAISLADDKPFRWAKPIDIHISMKWNEIVFFFFSYIQKERCHELWPNMNFWCIITIATENFVNLQKWMGERLLCV